jgi:hypothetical protein
MRGRLQADVPTFIAFLDAAGNAWACTVQSGFRQRRARDKVPTVLLAEFVHYFKSQP